MVYLISYGQIFRCVCLLSIYKSLSFKILIFLALLFQSGISFAWSNYKDHQMEVFKIKESEYLEVLSNINKIRGQMKKSSEDIKRLEKQNELYFIQKIKQASELERISNRKKKVVFLPQELEKIDSHDIKIVADFFNSSLWIPLQTEAIDFSKSRFSHSENSSDFSPNIHPSLQISESGAVLQNLTKEIGEKDQIIRDLIHKLESYKKMPILTDHSALSLMQQAVVRSIPISSSILKESVLEDQKETRLSRTQESSNQQKDQLIQFQENLKQKNLENEELIQVKEDQKESIVRVKQDNEQLRKNLKDSQFIQEQVKQELLLLQENYEKDLAGQREQMEKTQKKHQEELNRIQENHRLEQEKQEEIFSEEKKKLNKEWIQVNEHLQNTLQKINREKEFVLKEHAEQIKLIEENYKKVFEDRQKEYDLILASKDKDLKLLQENHQKELTEKEKKFKEQFDLQQKELEARKKILKKQEEVTSQLKHQYEEQMKSTGEEYQNILDIKNKELELINKQLDTQQRKLEEQEKSFVKKEQELRESNEILLKKNEDSQKRLALLSEDIVRQQEDFSAETRRYEQNLNDKDKGLGQKIDALSHLEKQFDQQQGQLIELQRDLKQKGLENEELEKSLKDSQLIQEQVKQKLALLQENYKRDLAAQREQIEKTQKKHQEELNQIQENHRLEREKQEETFNEEKKKLNKGLAELDEMIDFLNQRNGYLENKNKKFLEDLEKVHQEKDLALNTHKATGTSEAQTDIDMNDVKNLAKERSLFKLRDIFCRYVVLKEKERADRLEKWIQIKRNSKLPKRVLAYEKFFSERENQGHPISKETQDEWLNSLLASHDNQVIKAALSTNQYIDPEKFDLLPKGSLKKLNQKLRGGQSLLEALTDLWKKDPGEFAGEEIEEEIIAEQNPFKKASNNLSTLSGIFGKILEKVIPLKEEIREVKQQVNNAMQHAGEEFQEFSLRLLKTVKGFEDAAKEREARIKEEHDRTLWLKDRDHGLKISHLDKKMKGLEIENRNLWRKSWFLEEKTQEYKDFYQEIVRKQKDEKANLLQEIGDMIKSEQKKDQDHVEEKKNLKEQIKRQREKKRFYKNDSLELYELITQKKLEFDKELENNERRYEVLERDHHKQKSLNLEQKEEIEDLSKCVEYLSKREKHTQSLMDIQFIMQDITNEIRNLSSLSLPRVYDDDFILPNIVSIARHKAMKSLDSLHLLENNLQEKIHHISQISFQGFNFSGEKGANRVNWNNVLYQGNHHKVSPYPPTLEKDKQDMLFVEQLKEKQFSHHRHISILEVDNESSSKNQDEEHESLNILSPNNTIVNFSSKRPMNENKKPNPLLVKNTSKLPKNKKNIKEDIEDRENMNPNYTLSIISSSKNNVVSSTNNKFKELNEENIDFLSPVSKKRTYEDYFFMTGDGKKKVQKSNEDDKDYPRTTNYIKTGRTYIGRDITPFNLE